MFIWKSFNQNILSELVQEILDIMNQNELNQYHYMRYFVLIVDYNVEVRNYGKITESDC